MTRIAFVDTETTGLTLQDHTALGDARWARAIYRAETEELRRQRKETR